MAKRGVYVYECADGQIFKRATMRNHGKRGNVLVLPYPLARPVEAVAADEGDGEEVVGWAEAAGGEVALFLVGV